LNSIVSLFFLEKHKEIELMKKDFKTNTKVLEKRSYQKLMNFAKIFQKSNSSICQLQGSILKSTIEQRTKIEFCWMRVCETLCFVWKMNFAHLHISKQ